MIININTSVHRWYNKRKNAMEVYMTRFTVCFIAASLFFQPLLLILVLAGYLFGRGVLRFFDRILDKDRYNRLGLGAYCSVMTFIIIKIMSNG